jgi:hypothetical protein
MKRQTLESKIAELIEAADFKGDTFDVIAMELIHDGQGWSVNTPFAIGRGVDKSEVLTLARHRWEIFKANYMARAKVSDIEDTGFDGLSLECACVAFLDIIPNESR